MAKTLEEKIADADARCNNWLAKGNAAEERGNNVLAQICFEKSGYWRDRYNKLVGNA